MVWGVKEVPKVLDLSFKENCIECRSSFGFLLKEILDSFGIYYSWCAEFAVIILEKVYVNIINMKQRITIIYTTILFIMILSLISCTKDSKEENGNVYPNVNQILVIL